MRESGPILVPLDSSKLAEVALAYGAALARALGERLVLLAAYEGADSDLAASFPSMALEIEQQAKAHYTGYLKGASESVAGAQGVETIVRHGHAGDVIVKAADEIGARLIVLATHGRSGVGRWLYGSTASHVLRHANVPVVAIGPHALERPRGEVAVKHVMVPLDGAEASEEALPVAHSLAKACGARVSVVRVVQWATQAYPYTLPDAYVPQLDEELEAGAKDYVRRKQHELQGVEASAFVVRGAVADGLFEFVEREAVDLVVMTTHARSGLLRMALGSVADRTIQGAAPVLLIRPAHDGTATSDAAARA